MPGVNWIPGISQLKSAVQLVTGDVKGAAQTQKDFVQECPVVSQVTSVVQLTVGETDAALETQKKCLGTVSSVTDGIPGVGHVKGFVHHAVGDKEGGNRALNAATRSTVVVGSGFAAGIASGGLMGIPAGIAAGTAYDMTHSIIENKPKGYFAAFENAVQNPSGGNIFDAVIVPVGDGLAGYGGGKMGESVGNAITGRKIKTAQAEKKSIDNVVFDGRSSSGGGGMTSGAPHKLGGGINAMTGIIDKIEKFIEHNANEVSGLGFKTNAEVFRAASATVVCGFLSEDVRKQIWPRRYREDSRRDRENLRILTEIHREQSSTKHLDRSSKTSGSWEMAENARTVIKIRELESERAAIQKVIDEAIGGSSTGLTSGKLQELGRKVNSLTRQIEVLTRSEKYCWYDCNTEKVIIASRAPNENCDLVIADVDESASPADLKKLAELYLRQQRDSYNKRYSEDDKSYDTQEERLERLDYYAKAKPTQTVNELKPGMRLRFSDDPTKPPQKSDDLLPTSRKPFFMALQTPDQFKYSILLLGNSANEGLLHALLRHGHQLKLLGLPFDILPILTRKMLWLAEIIRETQKNEAEKRAFQDELFRVEEAIYQEILDLQLRLHAILQNLLRYENYLGDNVNTNGQLQVFWKVDAETVMMFAMSRELLRGEESINFDRSGKKRPLRTIITICFITPDQFLRKKRNGLIKRTQ